MWRDNDLIDFRGHLDESDALPPVKDPGGIAEGGEP